MMRTLLMIFSGSAGAAAFSFIRNLIVARMISVEDYGIAATFAIVMTVIEMLSSLGMPQQIVQAREGQDPKFQAGLQGFNLLRGVIGAVVLVLAAGWVSAFMGIPEVAWAYQVLAIVPLMNGLQHFDMHRMKRQMRFGPSIAFEMVPVLISMLAAFPLALWLGDYRVMLAAIVIQMVLAVAVSHVVAERAFRIRLDLEVFGKALKFGWPILLNHLLLFLIFNGEKIIVGRDLGMEPLAILAMAFTLTLTPTLVLERVGQNFFLPQLSANQTTPATFDRLAVVTLQMALLNGALIVLAMVLIGPGFVRLVLGEGYEPLAGLIIWAALLNGIRALKSGAAVIALSRGANVIVLIANLFRVASLPLSLWALQMGEGLLTVILIATLGEICGGLMAYWLVIRRMGVDLRAGLVSVLASVVFFALAAATAGWPMAPAPLQQMLPQGAMAGLCVAAFVGLLWSMRVGRDYLRDRQMLSFDE